MNALRSLAFAIVFFGGSAVYVALAMVVLLVAPQRMGPLAHDWSRFHRWCVVHLLQIAVNESGPRPPGAAIYAFKHESFFEAIDLPNLLGRPVPFAKQELFAIPGWGRAARAYGAVPVARQDGARALRAMVSEARRFAATGRPLAIFPEGTRVEHGQSAPLQAGFAALYKALALPVVPVAVDSGRTYGRRFWKKRGTIHVRFGEAIAPGLPRAEIEAQVFAAINALNRAPPPAG